MHVKPEYNHGVNLPDLIGFRKLQHCKRFLFHALEQKQLAGSSPIGIYRKIHPAGDCRRPVHLVHTGPDLITVDHIHRLHMDLTDRRYQFIAIHCRSSVFFLFITLPIIINLFWYNV